MARRDELTDLQRRVFALADQGRDRVSIAKELRIDRGTPGRFLRQDRLRLLWEAERKRSVRAVAIRRGGVALGFEEDGALPAEAVADPFHPANLGAGLARIERVRERRLGYEPHAFLPGEPVPSEFLRRWRDSGAEVPAHIGRMIESLDHEEPR